MPHRPTLHDFVDDELLRAPLTLDRVIDEVQERWRLSMPVRSGQDGDSTRVLQQHRGDLVTAALRSLRQSAEAELRGGYAAVAPAPTQRGELSLIGEDDVAVDIKIARCTETVKLLAETELRDLQTYTSALVDDHNISRDTNPFRPERFVRALWSGVQALPLSRALQAVFLHDAAEPLAEALRRAYAGAIQRLEEQGITPANHRTIVYGGGTAWGFDLTRHGITEDLKVLRESMPMPLDEPPVGSRVRPPERAIAAPVQAPDPQLIELLARLFEAIQADCGLGADTVGLLQRLHPTALRVALHDPALLDTYDHPAWRFIDQLAHDIEASPPAQRLRLLGLGRNLVDHLAASDLQHGGDFAWSLQRLEAARRHALTQAISVAAPEIVRLQRVAAARASSTTRAMALDIGTLDTVPAELMPEAGATEGGSSLPADGMPAGAQLRMVLQGEWRQMVSLWQDKDHELVLLRELATERLWALRQHALAELFAEGLARPWRVRSLVRRAAEKVLRAL